MKIVIHNHRKHYFRSFTNDLAPACSGSHRQTVAANYWPTLAVCQDCGKYLKVRVGDAAPRHMRKVRTER